ncbi:MAG: hypothetical protein EBZ36_00860, partial [Acidobacteria bacterium]|nr:hypothetical protein [Acidobacteriota bacterium]
MPIKFYHRSGLLGVLLIIVAGLAAVAPVGSVWAQETPRVLAEMDRRFAEIRHLDLKYAPPGRTPSRNEWEKRADQLRQQILGAAGLLPMPERSPLNAQIYGRIDRGSYTVEKVYFESLPGFYVTGSLFRPKGLKGKAPAVLCPHGHWSYGRLENSHLNSTAGRAANFAMQGYVAFSYDMVGYGDIGPISHRFAYGHREGNDIESLWSVNLLGLQLWNSMRSIDLLQSLPEVDGEQISVTGESGGGTQTFLLTAVDDRIKASGPVNMISYVMQGGSLCENAPNLRIDTENVEIGALAAPRPLIMVSATGDWTSNTWIEEYPAVRSIYRLFDADDRLTTIQINAPHNYNRDSREAVYTWFARWFLGRQETTLLREQGWGTLSATDLLVFYGRPRPGNEVDESALTKALIQGHQRQRRESFARGLESYRAAFGPTFRQSLLASYPEASELSAKVMDALPTGLSGLTGRVGRTRGVVISRPAVGDIVRVYQTSPARSGAGGGVTLLIDPLPAALKFDPETIELHDELVRAGQTVVIVKVFPGERQVPADYKFFTTYNRTDAALRVQDILTSLAWAKGEFRGSSLSVVANGEAGLWALLARGLTPGIDRMIVDAAGFDSAKDEEYVTRLPIPGLRRAGDFTTAIALA